MKDTIQLFREADWNNITLRLVKYALFKVRRLEWKTGNFLPKGLLPEDIALEAIRKTCEGIVAQASGKGIRNWNPEVEPELLEHLKGVVDSDVSALVRSAEHRLTNYSAKISSYEANEAVSQSLDSGLAVSCQAYGSSAEEQIIEYENAANEEQRLETLLKDLYLMCIDNEEELVVLLAFQEAAKKHDKVKFDLVAKYAGLDEKTARNAIRRLTRKAEKRRVG
ncbi:MAG: hypothetical protein AB1540_03600 [Bdellovibrionota bacterium]